MLVINFVTGEDNKPRTLWRIGKIEELIIGKDNIAGGAVVRVHAKEGKSKQLRRPLQKLFPLELSGPTSTSSTGSTSTGSTSTAGASLALKGRERKK